MEDKERRIVSFQVYADELQAIENAAAELGVSRSEYLRTKVISTTGASDERNPDDSPRDVERLLRHLVYITSRTHVAVYAIPETAETLSTKQLRTIYDDARSAGLEYIAELPERMRKAEAGVANHSRKDKPPEVA